MAKKMIKPVGSDWTLTQGVGNWLVMNGITYGYHPGEDWNWGSGNADIGKPVVAVADGVVVKSSWLGNLGGHLVIRHVIDGKDIYSHYVHITTGLKVGDPVSIGSEVAKLANISASGLYSHLHFELRDKPDFDWSNGNKYGYYSSLDAMAKDGILMNGSSPVQPSNFIKAHESAVNIINGTNGSDTKIGTASDDSINGYDGDDFLGGADGNDTLIGGAGNDRMDAGNGNDALSGGIGNDILNGGTGNDTMDGGTGVDTVSYLNIASGVTVNLWMTQAQNTGGAGIDTITNVENVSGTAYKDTLVGNAGDNVIDGREGDDFLGGESGNDTLIGGAGNDRMDAGNGNDKLSGDVGNDILNGGAGNDTMDGGAGVDTVSYLNVVSGVVVNLSVVTAQNTGGAGYDTITNVENAAGTAFADTLTGNTGANDLNGREGNDILNGGAGNDTLQGGTGKDVLTGGTGKDVFVFNTSPNTLTNLDKITDFSVVDDTIYLDNSVFTRLVDGGVSASMFRSGAGKALDSNDYLLYNSQTGALSYDADGNGAGAAVQIAQLGTNLALTSADFFVI